MQLDSHCAPRKRPHPAEKVSCSGFHHRAETTMMHRLHRSAKKRSTSRDPVWVDLPQNLASRHPIIPCRLLDLVPPSSLTATASWIIPAFRLAERLAPNSAWLSPGTAETITATSWKPGTVTGAGEESSADGYMEASHLQEPNVGRVFTAPLGDVHLWSHVSCCCCLDLRAGISATGQRHCALPDPQRKARSPSPGHVTRTALLRHLCGRSQADT